MIWTSYESPLGPLTLIGGPRGLRNVYFPGRGPRRSEGDRDPAAFTDTTAQLDEYFAGTRRTFELPLDLDGTAFQRRVWDALRQIPYGGTTTYGTLARALGASSDGDASAPQKVGWAIGRTPTPIVVPCHRVLAADGSLTGYLGGLHRKQALLDLEAAGRPSPDIAGRWTQRQLVLL